MTNQYGKIGPAIIEDIAKHTQDNDDFTSPIILYVLPQLDGTRNLVASWEKNQYLYKLYHDSYASEIVKFNVQIDEISSATHTTNVQKYRSFMTYKS